MFLTKYPELRPDESIKMLQWYQIKEMAQSKEFPFTKELYHYLKERGMNKIEIFKEEDFFRLSNIQDTINKMEAVLNPCTDYFMSQTKLKTKTEQRNRLNFMMVYSGYFDYKWPTNKDLEYEYSFSYGFTWLSSKTIDLHFLFNLPFRNGKENSDQFFEFFKAQKLDGVEYFPSSDAHVLGWKKAVHEFGDEADQLNKMRKKLVTWMNQIIPVIKKNKSKFD